MVMGKINDLPYLVTTKLKTVCDDVYFEMADEHSMYPHIVFDYNRANSFQNTLDVNIDIWDKNESAVAIENLTDAVEELFNNINSPQDTIIPTFYVEDRVIVPDPDKKLRRRRVKLSVNFYERSIEVDGE